MGILHFTAASRWAVGGVRGIAISCSGVLPSEGSATLSGESSSSNKAHSPYRPTPKLVCVHLVLNRTGGQGGFLEGIHVLTSVSHFL